MGSEVVHIGPHGELVALNNRHVPVYHIGKSVLISFKYPIEKDSKVKGTKQLILTSWNYGRTYSEGVHKKVSFDKFINEDQMHR